MMTVWHGEETASPEGTSATTRLLLVRGPWPPHGVGGERGRRNYEDR